jgi:hypothetical protein
MSKEKKQIDEEVLNEVESLAYGLLSKQEICIVTEIDYEAHKKHFNDPEHVLYKAYQKGLLKLKYELNTANVKFAKQSSSHAMNKVLKELDKLIVATKKDE